MKPRILLSWILIIIAWTTAFSYLGSRNLDPDFGWHVRMGQVILTSGIPATDPFSYTMPSYPFIDHEWLTNVVMYAVLEHFGYLAEAVVFGLIAGIFLIILVPASQLTWSIVPLLLASGVWTVRGGIRPQMLDWIFLTLLLRLFWDSGTWKKWRWVIIPLFALWANLHGGFAIGPAVLAAALFFRSWEQKKVDIVDLLVWTASLLATLINPYGFGMWHEVWMQITDSNLRSNVSEWQPFWVRAELGSWLLIAFIIAMLKSISFKIEKWKIALLICFIVAGLSSLRHLSLLMIMLVLLGSELIRQFIKSISRNIFAMKRAQKFFYLLIGISTLVFVEEAGVTIWKTSRGRGGISYPEKAVRFLKAADYPGNVFSEYGWGGFLIWQYPGKKVFVDGRMPSWRWTAPSGESDWAFKDYIRIRDKAGFRDLFAKYDIRLVLWPKTGLTTEKLSQNTNSWWSKLMSWRVTEQPVSFTEKLEEAGWHKVYEDVTSVVYVDQL